MAALIATILAAAVVAAYADTPTNPTAPAPPAAPAAAASPAPPPPPPPPPPSMHPTMVPGPQAPGRPVGPANNAPGVPGMPGPPVQPLKPLVGPPGVAAVIDGHIITIDQVKDLAFTMAGTNAVNQIIQFTLIDEEAKRQNVKVTNADVDQRIAEIRARVETGGQGQKLETLMKQRNMTMPSLRQNLYHIVELQKIADKGVVPPRMVHVHHILIKVTTTPPASTSGTQSTPAAPAAAGTHSDAEALALIKTIQDQLKDGKSFDDLAKQYSEDTSNKATGGDLTGLVYTGGMYDPNFTAAAIALKKGEITATPAKSMFGYHLIEAISTSDDHPTSENKLYQDALNQYMEQQAQKNQSAILQQLQAKSQIVNYMIPPNTLTMAPSPAPKVTAAVHTIVKPKGAKAPSTAKAITAKKTAVVKQ